MTSQYLVRTATIFLILTLLLLPAAASTGTFVSGETRGETASPPVVETELKEYRRYQAELRAIRADDVHAQGITGEGVQVGVIGSAFAPATAPIRDNLAAHHGFGSHASAFLNSKHGTAVAEIVAEMAPDSRLYLASVGSHPTPSQYRAAVRWLLANEVDVIVDAGSYFPGRAGDAITAIATNASRQGVVFVTSAGNYATRHWTGNGTASGWVVFDAQQHVQANPLNDGNATSGTVSIRLQWNSSADYDLYLYRQLDSAPDRVVAKSTRRQAADTPSIEALDVAVPRGQYYVAIYAKADTAPNDHLHIFSAHQSLGYAQAQGSVLAPATSQHVIAVGAVDHQGNRRVYSSLGRGNTVDVSAPDGIATTAAGPFYGTSAAAPIVAGTAALMESHNRSLSPSQVERILQYTASKENNVDALAAVRAVTNGTLENATRTNATANGTPDASGTQTATSYRDADFVNVYRQAVARSR